MAVTIDSAVVLRAMADHPEAFPALKADIDEVARKLLVKQLKAKTTDVGLLKRIFAVTSEDTMLTILDGFSANDLASLIKKVDPHSAFTRTGANIQEGRLHVVGLANGRVNPSAPAAKVAKAPRKAVRAVPSTDVSKIGTILESKVHSGKPRPSRAKRAV